MEKTLHLHVGLPKCGSSSLQHFLRDNRDSLLAVGFDYPELTSRSNGNLTPYMKSFGADTSKTSVFWQNNADQIGRDHAADLWAAVDASPAENIILSAESVTRHLQTPYVQALLDRFTTKHIYIAMRPPVDWMCSHFAQRTKTGKYRMPFDEFLDSEAFDTHVVNMLSYSDHVRACAELAGPARTHILFAGKRFPSVVTQFLQAAGTGLSEAPAQEETRRNTSLSPFVLTVLGAVRRASRAEFQSQSRMVVQLARKLDPAPAASFITPDLVATMRTRFQRSTEELLAMQDGVTEEDLWPDYTVRFAHSTTSAAQHQSEAFELTRQRLWRKGIKLKKPASAP